MYRESSQAGEAAVQDERGITVDFGRWGGAVAGATNSNHVGKRRGVRCFPGGYHRGPGTPKDDFFAQLVPGATDEHGMKQTFRFGALVTAALIVQVSTIGCVFEGGGKRAQSDDGFGTGANSGKRKPAGGTCVGTPTPCTLLSADECSWRTNCDSSGTTGGCEGYHGGSISQCEAAGCQWSVLGDYCYKWHATCSGDPGRCEDRRAEYCEDQPGCTWHGVCPVQLDEPPACANCAGERCCDKMTVCSEGTECAALIKCEYEFCSEAVDLGPCLKSNCAAFLGGLGARDALLQCVSNCSAC